MKPISIETLQKWIAHLILCLLVSVKVGATTSVDLVSSTIPDELCSVGDQLFFRGNDGSSGNELWKSDGTTIGTSLVKDISTGSSVPSELTEVNGELYFRAVTPSAGYELWKSDGTSIGTNMIKDIQVGTSGSFPEYLTEYNDALYFAADDGSSVEELWKSDGTSAGTVNISDLNAGATDSFPREMAGNGGILFFSAVSGTYGRELSQLNVTTLETTFLKNIYPGAINSVPRDITPLGSLVCFSAIVPVIGSTLWVSDGTPEGTIMINNTANVPKDFTELDGELYFIAGTALWKTNGTSAGTTLVRDLGGIDDLTSLKKAGDSLFLVRPSQTSNQLWVSDGSYAGTVMIKNFAAESDYQFIASHLTEIGDDLFFAVYDSTNSNSQAMYSLWRSDGTAVGTAKFTNVAVRYDNSSKPDWLVLAGSRAFYGGYDSTTGHGLYAFDVAVLPDNQNPTAIASYNVIDSSTSQIQLDASSSTDPDGSIINYAWSWSGGSSTGVSTTVTLPPGETLITLSVTDDSGGIGETTLTVAYDSFASALSAAGLIGDDAELTATPFGDGVSNLLKLAFNMNLSGPDASAMELDGDSGLPGAQLVEEEGQSYWQVQYLQRRGSGLVYTPQKTADLTGGFTPLSGSSTIDVINGEWERVTVNEPCDPASTPSCFSRVLVELP